MRMEEKRKVRPRKLDTNRKNPGPIGSTISRIEKLINDSKSAAMPRFDKDGLICGWDSSCERVYGYTAADTLGKRLQEVLQSEQQAKRFEKILRQILEVKQTSVEDKFTVPQAEFKSLRKTGISIIGDVPWGTHFCQFYQTKQDLIDVLVPYFKAGLENNEFCMWVTCEPLQADEARQALAERVANLDKYIKNGQLEILDYTQWYTKSGTFESELVLQGWVDKKMQARKMGFDGLRLTGNTFWLPKRRWKEFATYEAKINSVLGRYRMLALCTYHLNKCDEAQITDVVSNHQFALIRREGKWEIIENSEHKKSLEALRNSEERYKTLLEGLSYGVAEINSSGRIIFANKALYEIYGYADGQLLDKEVFGLIASEAEKKKSRKQIIELRQGQLLSIPYESKGLTKDGRVIDIELRWDYKRDQWGRVTGFIAGITDITQRKQTERIISKKLAFEKTVSAISSRFAGDTNIDEAISASLQEMGMVTGACRTYVFLYRQDETIMDNTHEWCAEGISPQIDNMQNLPLKMFPWWTKKLHEGKVINIEDVSKLPDEAAAERKTLESQNVKSLLALPLNLDGRLAGFIGFDNTSSTGKWPQEDIVLLRICSEIIGSAIHRQRNRENLEKSREWFRAIADYTCDLESWHGVDGKLLWINPAVERLTGYTVEECMNMPDYPLPFVYKDDRKGIEKILKEAVEERTSDYDVPFRIWQKDGVIRWVEMSWQPVYSDAKAYIGIRSSIHDVTEEKLAEEALQQSESRYRSLINDVLDSSAVGIFILNADFRVIWMNNAMERYFGLSRDEIVGSNKRELIHGKIKHIFEDPEEFADKVLATYENNTYSERFECHVLAGDSRRERWLEHRSMPIRSGPHAGGRIEHYYDITERKQMENLLRHERHRLEIILETIPSGVILIEKPDGKITYMNRRAVELYGWKPQENLTIPDHSRSLKLLLPNGNPFPPEELPASRALQQGEAVNNKEVVIEQPNGNRITVLAGAAPLRDEDGNVVAAVGAFEDMTARKQAEEELRRTLRELETRVSKRTEELTKAHQHLLREIRERKALEKEILKISEREKRVVGQELHDSIGQQFMGISFMAKVLEQKLSNSLPEAAESAKAISKLVNHAIDQMRALAKGLHPVDLDGNTFASALHELATLAERMFGIRCTVKCDTSVVVDDTTVAVNLYRIAQEAVTNAVKHGKTRNVQIELANSTDRAFLIVKNDGLSFPETTGETSGMGLRIMDHRAEIIGGSLNIRRNMDGGTVLTCCFPNKRL